MARFFKHTIAAVALAALPLTLPGTGAAQDATPQPASPNEIVKATHGAWDVVCAKEQAELCVMRQFGKNAEGKILIDVRIRPLEGVTSQEGKTFPAAIQITTPLGTILSAGVTVKVDAGEPRTGAFELCIPSGCLIRDPMSEEFLAALKAGKVAIATFNLLQLGVVNVNISLKGFTKAFKAL